MSDNHPGARDQTPADEWIELFPGEVVPAVMRRAISHDCESMDRWTTFDCYGTLIDWNGGIGRELERLFGAEQMPELLHRYHEVEPELQREQPEASYRQILTQALPRLGPVPAAEEDALARSLPAWPPFPEVPVALEDARARGWKLA